MVHVKKTHNSKQSPMYMLMMVPVSPASVQFIALLCVSAVHSATLFLNVMACLAYFTADAQNGVDFGLSILWFLLFTPVSFICWYRPVYKAFRYAGLVALRWNIFKFALQSGCNCFVLQAEEIGTYADEVVGSVSFFFSFFTQYNFVNTFILRLSQRGERKYVESTLYSAASISNIRRC